uniref:Uncharacterized protein n=1 Tax=Amphimedon queenslandica TaxID=400682 RepID=A0A1X7T9X6_AMPQE
NNDEESKEFFVIKCNGFDIKLNDIRSLYNNNWLQDQILRPKESVIEIYNSLLPTNPEIKNRKVKCVINNLTVIEKSGTQMVRQWILNEIGKSISSGLLGENITCEENMEIMKKEIAATQYIYTENDETFDTCDDLSKDEDTDSDTQSSDIDADELNRQFS